MKKYMSVFLSFLCLFSLSSCSESISDDNLNAINTEKKDGITIQKEIGTFESPVQLGEPREVTDFFDNTYDFTVTDAYVGQEAIRKAAALDEYGLNKLVAEDGIQYILVHYSITAKNLSSQKFDFNPLYISIWVNNVEGKQILLYGDVQPSVVMEDGTTDGWAAFSVDSLGSNPLLELQLDAVPNERSCWFSLT